MTARIALLLATGLSCVLAADPPSPPGRDGLILRLKPSATIGEALKVISEDRIASSRRLSRTTEIYVVTLRPGHSKELDLLSERLRLSGLVEYAEPDSKIHFDPEEDKPADNKPNFP